MGAFNEGSGREAVAMSEPGGLGYYRATAEGDPMPEMVLEWEATDGIRTHDLLRGKQRQRRRRLTTQDSESRL